MPYFGWRRIPAKLYILMENCSGWFTQAFSLETNIRKLGVRSGLGVLRESTA